MKKSKVKAILILVIIMILSILSLSMGVYAGYQLSATEVIYTKPDGTTVTLKQALDELYSK